MNREDIAETFLIGDGIEIGALHNPLRLPSKARIKYVDRMPVSDLRRHYPELEKKSLVAVDIIDDGERLKTLADGSQDFVVANHFLEHCQDPIGALLNLLRVLRPGGVAYIALPDKRFSFDVDRPVTPLSHLMRDHREGPEWSYREHLEEWARLVDKVPDVSEYVDRLAQAQYSIHFHVWTPLAMLDWISHVQTLSPFEIAQQLHNDTEAIFILRKSATI